MLAHLTDIARQVGRCTIVTLAGAAIALPALLSPAAARGPDAIADVAEKVIDAVVNISTSQSLGAKASPTPQLPPGSPFEEFFDEFFKNRREGDRGGRGGSPRRVNSLGSGFIIDAAGIVVTNNHVISEADEVHVILNDGTRLKAEVIGRDQKIDLAVLKVTPTKPLKAVNFGDSDKLRLGEWVIAIGNPFMLGGTVTAGIVSARNRDINSGPYDNYIQTDASINRGNSGGPLFNLEGEVIGVNTAIISPSGGSIGIGFAVPSKTVVAVIDQLRQYGETRRGWLGVKIQPVTEEIGEALNIKPARGTLIAGIDEKGPAKAAGIETGDVILKFDGKDIKETRDLTRMVADTPVDKEVEVVIIRKGKEEKKSVKVGRLEDSDKKLASITANGPAEEKPAAVKKALGLDLADINDDLRRKYNIKDNVKGAVVTAVEQNSSAAEKQMKPGDTIVEISQVAVVSAADVQRRVDQLKKEGRKSALFLVANKDGETRFVALNLQ
ncbi:MAG TPA: Do family serine endopeptidase [Xanthobacteraceae bacterium]|nr:Do family serine endopeptidase [Xanthobacteraceae bacterium]